MVLSMRPKLGEIPANESRKLTQVWTTLVRSLAHNSLIYGGRVISTGTQFASQVSNHIDHLRSIRVRKVGAQQPLLSSLNPGCFEIAQPSQASNSMSQLSCG
jgi:hypothetical protein